MVDVKILLSDGKVAGKLAEAELVFTDGPLQGMKLLGFTVWQRRNSTERYITYPSRTYTVNGERRSFALFRPWATDPDLQARVPALILSAFERELEAAETTHA